MAVNVGILNVIKRINFLFEAQIGATCRVHRIGYDAPGGLGQGAYAETVLYVGGIEVSRERFDDIISEDSSFDLSCGSATLAELKEMGFDPVQAKYQATVTAQLTLASDDTPIMFYDDGWVSFNISATRRIGTDHNGHPIYVEGELDSGQGGRPTSFTGFWDIRTAKVA